MRRRGFTLLELMIVILLLALVAGVAIPRLSGVLPGASLRGAGRTLSSDLRYLYGYAVARREYVRMAIDLDAGTYWAERFTPEAPEEESHVLALHLTTDFGVAGVVRTDDVTDVERLDTALTGVRRLPRGIRFDTVRVADGFTERGGRVYIEFSPWGYGDNAEIVLALGDQSRTVRLDGLLGEAGLTGGRA